MSRRQRDQAKHMVAFELERVRHSTDSFTRMDFWARVAALAQLEVERTIAETEVEDDQLALDVTVLSEQAGAIA